MSTRKDRYVRIADRVAESGEYELIEPLDYKIMEMLPNEGEMFAGLYPLGETASAIKKKFGNKLDSHVIAQRLRVMRDQGLVSQKNAPGTAGTSIWQRTTVGKEVLEKWQSTQSS